MQIYWTLKSIPELAQLPASQRRRVWCSAYWRAFRDWRMQAAMFVTGLCAGIGFVAGHALDWPIVSGLIGSAIGGFLSGQIVVDLVRSYVPAQAFIAAENTGAPHFENRR